MSPGPAARPVSLAPAARRPACAAGQIFNLFVGVLGASVHGAVGIDRVVPECCSRNPHLGCRHVCKLAAAPCSGECGMGDISTAKPNSSSPERTLLCPTRPKWPQALFIATAAPTGHATLHASSSNHSRRAVIFLVTATVTNGLEVSLQWRHQRF